MARKKPKRVAATCKRPDRDVPGLVCGHPLPCPWHTVTIDMTTEPAEVRAPFTAEPAANPKLLATLKDIGRAILEYEDDGGTK